MGSLAQVQAAAGAGAIPSFASATRLEIPGDVSLFYLTGTTTLSLLVTPIRPGRRLTIIGGTGTREIQNTEGGTVAFSIDVGGALESLALGATDVIQIVQLENGAWLATFTTDN